jgi:hypothetical protein
MNIGVVPIFNVIRVIRSSGAILYYIIVKLIININIPRLKGRNLFHVRYIKLSYRIRGRVARTQMNTVAMSIVLIMSHKFLIIKDVPVKKITVKSLIIRILAYSAIKIKAKLLLPYSTLNPDTNSDSPSAKSNGVRFVSARFVIIHVIKIGIAIKLTHDNEFIDITDISIW